MYRPIEPETYSVGDIKFDATNEERRPQRKKPGPKAKPVVEFPEAAHGPWIDPAAFSQALSLHMKRHGDNQDQKMARAATGDVEIGEREKGAESTKIIDDHNVSLEPFERARGRTEDSFSGTPVGSGRDDLDALNLGDIAEISVALRSEAKEDDLISGELFGLEERAQLLDDEADLRARRARAKQADIDPQGSACG